MRCTPSCEQGQAGVLWGQILDRLALGKPHGQNVSFLSSGRGGAGVGRLPKWFVKLIHWKYIKAPDRQDLGPWPTLYQSVTFVKIWTRMNIRIYSSQKIYTNEYPNIFVLKKQYEWISEYISIRKMIRIWYERIFISKNIRMYEYIRIKFLILVLDLMLEVEFLMCDTTES